MTVNNKRASRKKYANIKNTILTHFVSFKHISKHQTYTKKIQFENTRTNKPVNSPTLSIYHLQNKMQEPFQYNISKSTIISGVNVNEIA